MANNTSFFIIPLPHKQQEIALSEKTVVGRKTLSDLQVKSTQYKKKLSVSRQQAEITVSERTVMLHALGMNPMIVTRKNGKELRLEKGHKVFLEIGDVFTLCGKHFPFSLHSSKYTSTFFKDEVKLEKGVAVRRELNLNASGENSPDFFAKPGSEESPVKKILDVPQGSFLSPKGHQDPNLLRSRSLSGGALVGKRAKIFWDKEEKWYRGVVTSFKESTNQYEVRYDDGEVRLEAPDGLVFFEKEEVKSKKRKKEGKKGKGKKVAKIESGSDDEKGAVSGTRTSRRAGRQVNYVEWESSSSEDSENYTTYKTNDKPKKPKNLTVVNPEQLATEKTAIFYHPSCLKHFVPKWHLEKPERLLCIMETLEALVCQFPDVLKIVTSFEPVSQSTLTMVHEHEYLNRMERSIPNTDMPEHVTQYTQEMDDRNSQDFDTFMSRGSMEAARLAAGAACSAVDMVAQGRCRNAFCCVRPPGHHCGKVGHTEKAASQGYCIINNVAVASLYAQSKYQFKKIAVVDFDVHHGNGTEEVLGGREGFLFISIHVGDIYPRTGRENKPRKSNVVCISLESFAGSDKFHSAFDARVIPALEQFRPDFLILSAGFDAHRKDPTENGLRLEEKDYYHITEKLKKIGNKYCAGQIVSVLEGGYHLPSLKKCVREHVISLMTK